MAKLSYYAFTASFIVIGAAMLTYLWYTVGRQKQAGRFATLFTYNGAALLTASLGMRWIVSGHAPYSNQFEFASSFAWGTVITYLYLEARYRVKSMGFLAIGVATAILTYASLLPARIDPLIAALQNNMLLTIHVAMAIISYGAFTSGFAAGVLYLVNRRNTVAMLPPADVPIHR